MIGDQDVGGIFFDVASPRNFYAPEGVDLDNKFSPEVCNAIGDFAIPIERFEEGDTDKCEKSIKGNEYPGKGG